jgi:hypothetical protein
VLQQDHIVRFQWMTAVAAYFLGELFEECAAPTGAASKLTCMPQGRA